MTQYFGKYSGKVTQNLDPQQMGRIQVSVPAVLGDGRLSWAMPCVPYAGSGAGFYAVPPIDANVWVEFEAGDIEKPIWSGCFWGKGETPKAALSPPLPIAHILMQTTSNNSIHISDAPGPAGGITLKISTGAEITINDVGITISNGKGAKITLTGASVDINDGALTVT